MYMSVAAMTTPESVAGDPTQPIADTIAVQSAQNQVSTGLCDTTKNPSCENQIVKRPEDISSFSIFEAIINLPAYIGKIIQVAVMSLLAGYILTTMIVSTGIGIVNALIAIVLFMWNTAVLYALAKFITGKFTNQ